MKYFVLILSFLAVANAGFVTSFDVPPAQESVLGTQIGSDEQTSGVLGEEVGKTEEEIRPYKEVRVEDLAGYGELKVALLVPKKVIKGYAKRVSNSIMSYFIFRDRDFTFEVFDCVDESEQNIIDTLARIKSKGYKYVIAVMTPSGAQSVINYESEMLVYIPTLHGSMFPKSGNIYYGGIDYKKQIDKLMAYSNGKVAIFMGKSWLAQRLTAYVQERNYDSYIKPVESAKINPKYIVKNNFHLQGASVFFNMPLVSSALLASSFSSYEIKPYALFSTQVNYSPLLFTMIQREDRQNFYLANSINYVNSKLNDTNQNLGIKIKYDWVAYSSSVGLDFIYSRYYGVDTIFNEDMIEHQIKYRTKIVKIKNDEFVRVK